MTTAKTVQRRFVLCPRCQKTDYPIDHLEPGRTFGPWPCNHCDHEFFGQLNEAGEVEITKIAAVPEAQVACLVRMGEVYFVVGSYRRTSGKDWYDYLFHSHQCPTNILRNVLAVYTPDYGVDPHGLLRFISAMPLNAYEDAPTEGGSLEALFRLFGTDGQDAPTEWPEEDGGVLPGIAEMQRAHARRKAPRA